MAQKNVDILFTVNDNYFKPDTPGYLINYKDNDFNIAAAFTAFDSETEEILDPTYVELVFERYYWGVQEDGKYKASRERINSAHKCTPEELGIVDNEKKPSSCLSIRGTKFLSKRIKRSSSVLMKTI